jgi:FAD binding domain
VTTALAPSPALFEAGAVLINRQGGRFCDELDQPALALPDQPDKQAYILLDEKIAQQFSAWPNFVSTAPGVAYAYLADYRRNRKDVFHVAPTLAGLAEQLGVAAAALEQAARPQHAPGSNRPPRAPLGPAPFYALGPVRSVFVHNEGGLAVDLEHRVLGPDDRPIPGLYAAGATGQGGLLLKGHGHHLAWAFTAAPGRMAARVQDRRVGGMRREAHEVLDRRQPRRGAVRRDGIETVMRREEEAVGIARIDGDPMEMSLSC